VAANKGGGTRDVSVTLSRTGGGFESHEWSFPIKSASFGYNTSTKKGSLKVTKAMGKYGEVKLALAKDGKTRNASCSSGKETVTPVSLKGIVYFDTRSSGSHRWGHVGSKTIKMTVLKHNLLTLDYNCSLKTPANACYSGTSWFTGSGGSHADLSGGSLGSAGTISADRSVSLKKPKGATRFDFVTVSAPKPVLKRASTPGGTTTYSVKTKKHTRATGSAQLSSTEAGTPLPGTCRSKGKTHETTTTFYDGSYTNGKPALVVHADIFGNFHVGNNKNSNFYSTSVS
jgi:hypothetical protein